MDEIVQLSTVDGETFEVQRKVAEVSQTLKDLLAESKFFCLRRKEGRCALCVLFCCVACV
jgi:Skp1 family, tetramerisation domain